jgi:hypothetical protein
VIIDDCETSMTIDGFQQAGGIAGTATGTGTLTITNTRAMNSVIFNTNNNYYVNPFFFGESSFAGTYISEDNYIWEGMVINGKTLDEWIRQTYNEERYTEENGYEKIPVSSNPPGGGESSNPSNPPNPSNVSPGIVTGDGSSITGVGVSTEVASGTAIDNRPASAQSGQSQNTNTPNVDTPITEPTTPEAAEPTPARTPTFFEIVVETVQNNPLVVVALIVAAGVLAMLGGLWRYRKTRRE